MTIDFDKVNSIIINKVEVGSIDLNGKEVWKSPALEPFYIEDISGLTNTVTVVKDDAFSPTIQVYYSKDAVNWSSMGSTSTSGISVNLPARGRIYLKAETNAWGGSISVCDTIKVSGAFIVGGNIMSLLKGDRFLNSTISKAYAFVRLFKGNTTLMDAGRLILPSNTYNTCYYEMFQGCTSLAIPPRIPAVTTARQCYEKMFDGCTGLKCLTNLATDLSGSQCMNNWVQNVGVGGIFYKVKGVSYPSGASGIPDGWEVVEV